MAFYGNQLTSVTIGANVKLDIDDRYDISPFDNGITAYYNRNGKKAGTYTLSGNRWSYRAQ
jgi:hypothetical protein